MDVMRSVLPRLLSAVVALAAVAAAVFLTPRSPAVSASTSGDPLLAERLRAVVGDGRGYQSVAAVRVTLGGVTHAAVGDAAPGRGPIGPTDAIELGSITKTFDGLLLAGAIGRGEVRDTDTLGDHIPELAGSAIGAVTLAEAVSHRGAIPPLPPSRMLGAVTVGLRPHNPYVESRAELLAEVRTMALLGERGGDVQYSNLGATLLGYALANAGGHADWDSYVTERLLTPLGMTSTRFAASDQQIPPQAPPGFLPDGRVAPRWPSEAFQPAGSSTLTTVDDLARYARAVLTGSAPGMDALDPRWDAGGDSRVGYAWFTSPHDDRDVVWHNGGTAGFSTMLALNRASGEAVFLVSNTTRGVDAAAVRLLLGSDEPVRPNVPIAGLALLAVAAASVLVLGWRAWRGSPKVTLLSSAADAVAVLAVARTLGPWSYLPGWIWAALVLLAASALATGLLTWSSRGTHGKRPRAGAAGLVLSLGLALAALVIVR